jgi:hypothetical protein
LDPADRRSELIGKPFDKDNVGEPLTIFNASPFVLFPLFENLVQFRQGSLIVDDLSVLARDIEWLGNEIRNIFAYKHVRVKVTRIDFPLSGIDLPTKLAANLFFEVLR